MKIKDIKLNNIKVVIFDFDNTLAIHKDEDYGKRRRESEDKYLEYYLEAYKNQDTFYEDIQPCIVLEMVHNFIAELKSRGIKIYCMSGMKFSFNLKAKQAFVNKHFGNDIDVLFTASQELKIEGTKIIQKFENCKLDEILFVDDKQEVVDLLNKAGINSMLVNDIEC